MGFRLDHLTIDPTSYAIAGNAILGIRDSGKTYTATFIAERLFDAGIPFIAFDPIGVWRFLRVPGSGKGYPVVVAGGQDGDLALTPASAPAIVEAAMQNGMSLVIDLFSIDLSKADWRRIVRDSVRLLLHKNSRHGLRHIFIEEASEFVPQQVRDGDVYAEVEKLARMGGNAHLGYTLVNQRAEEVNKAVLELCDNLFLHRQKGRNSLTALSKWLDIGAVKDHREIIDSLSTLPTGECWAWLGGSERPERVKVPAKRSLHPDRRITREAIAAHAKAVDVAEFVTTLRAALPVIEKEATDNDPKALRARIAELERQAKTKTAGPDLAALTAEREAGFAAGSKLAARGYAMQLNKIGAALANASRMVADMVEATSSDLAKPSSELVSRDTVIAIRDALRVNGRPRTPTAPTEPPKPTPTGALPEGERAVLIALAQHTDGCTRDQLSVLTGYKKSSRDAYVQRLRARGYAEAHGDTIKATWDGTRALGDDFKPLPTGAELLAHWLTKLPSGEAAILRLVAEKYPRHAEREWISAKTGYQKSSRDAYIQRLRSRKLVEAVGRGEVKANSDLFG
jgi:hypothetical protein